MTTNAFLHKDNISTLWDVISDEEMFKFLKRDNQEKISQMFINNLKGFHDTERKKTNNIVDINKKYILLILNYIKLNFSQSVPNKIKIYNEPPLKELITYEEIQTDRKSQFDRNLNKAQEEFNNAITLKVPDVPNFSDNYKETPITEMDKILKEMTTKRNYEVDQISRTNLSGEGDNASNWLKSQETSLKSEKFIHQEPDNSSRLKFLNNENVAPIQSPNSKKNVSWGNNSEITDNINIHYNTNEECDDNILTKFKKVKVEEKDDSKNELNELKKEITFLHSKLDTILKLLNSKN